MGTPEVGVEKEIIVNINRRRSTRVLVAALAVTAGALLLGGSVARAHVTIAEPEHVAGSFTLLTFGVPHGCEESPTTEVRIQMPESIPSVTPTVNPNWDVEKVMEELDPPLEGSHGEVITERVSEVVYTANTPLPYDYRDAFVLSLQIPEDAVGETIYFPTIQTCEEGETAWIEIPEAGQDGEELESPAPAIQIVAPADESGSDRSGSSETTVPATVTPGSTAAPTTIAVTATTTAAADGDSDDDGDSGNGLSIAALAVGLVGLGVGGTALARQRKQ
jgi:uncharacterized protein YcnI